MTTRNVIPARKMEITTRYFLSGGIDDDDKNNQNDKDNNNDCAGYSS